MNQDKLFISKRYVGYLDGITMYTNNTGVLKKCLSTILARRTINPDNIWYALEDLPIESQKELRHMAISASELNGKVQKHKDYFYDSEEVKIYISDNTLLLPIVGNFLPSDEIHAFTTEFQDVKITLKPIVVCWDCHWSELFTGQTKYKENVFCLVSDLTEEQRQIFKDKIIKLQEVPEYLEETKKLKLQK